MGEAAAVGGRCFVFCDTARGGVQCGRGGSAPAHNTPLHPPLPPPHTHQVRDALPWLNPRLEPSEARRYAAVLILRELADVAPAVFNVHVKAFIDGIWGGLRDAKPHVRDASVSALQVRGFSGRQGRGADSLRQWCVAWHWGRRLCGGGGAVGRCPFAAAHEPFMRRSLLQPLNHLPAATVPPSLCWCWWRSARRATASSGTTPCSSPPCAHSTGVRGRVFAAVAAASCCARACGCGRGARPGRMCRQSKPRAASPP